MIKQEENIFILLVDDDIDDRLLFMEAVHTTGAFVNCLTTDSCKQAITILKDGMLPDIIFVDINMPVDDGFECLRQIKKNLSWKHLPVIVYSTSNNDMDIRKAEDMGAAGYFKKPGDFTELCSRLKKILSGVSAAKAFKRDF